MNIAIVYEDEDIVVLVKPSGMPSAPLKKREGASNPTAVPSALEILCDIRPAVRSVTGRNEWEHGLIHRLDTDTRGLLLAAKNRKAFDFLAEEQAGGRFEKGYLAFVAESRTRKEGFPPLPEDFSVQKIETPMSIKCESRFRAWGRGAKEVRPVIAAKHSPTAAEKRTYGERKAGREIYETSIRLDKISIENLSSCLKKNTVINRDSDICLEILLNSLKNHTLAVADCGVSRGFRHQVRVHLAWLGFPVIGDRVYGEGSTPREKGEMLFFAVSLFFRHPATGEFVRFKITRPRSATLPGSGVRSCPR